MNISTSERILAVVVILTLLYRHETDEWPVTIEVEGT